MNISGNTRDDYNIPFYSSNMDPLANEVSLLLGLCHSVGVCSSTNLFLKASKLSEADFFLCRIDFFSIHALFLFFILEIILLLKFFSLAFLIVFLLSFAAKGYNYPFSSYP